METLSYMISFIATALGMCEPFRKKMKSILVSNFLANLLVGISYFLVSGYSGAAICFVACGQVLINYAFQARGKRIPTKLIVMHIVVFLVVNMLTFKAWYDIFAIIAAILFVLCVAQSNAKYYRVFYFLNAVVWIFYDLLAGAYGNLITHIMLFLATFSAIFVRDLRRRSDRRREP